MTSTLAKNAKTTPDASGDDPAFAMDGFITVRVVQLAEIISRGASERFEAEFGVKNTELRILVHLAGHQPLSVNEIARRTRVDKAWISRSAQALEQRGLIARTPHPTDIRSSLISLTAEGRGLVHRFYPVAEARNDWLLDGLDRAAVERTLNVLFARAEAILQNPHLAPPKAKRG